MLICLLLFSRRKRSLAASIFLLFSYYSQYYIYILYASFLSNKNQKDNIRGWLCILVCMCVCVYVRVNFLFSSLFKMWLKSGALIKKSRHDVAIASVPLKISQTSLHPNVLPSRRKFRGGFRRRGVYILHTRDASAIHDFTPTSNLRSTPRKIVTDVAR